MIKNILTVICQSIITDKETNLVSYLNCIEQIKSPQFPIRLPFVSLGMLWQKTEEKSLTLKVRIKLLSPDNKEKTIGEMKSDMNNPRQRQHIVMNGLPIECPGKYIFIVENYTSNKWKQATSVSLDVIQEKIVPNKVPKKID